MTEARSTRGVLLVIAGPSGVGKGTVVKALARRHRFWQSISLATREPREGERDGVHYHFVSREEFDRRRAAGELLEAFEVYGEWKGTPKAPILQALARGDDVLLEIDVQGALEIKRVYPNALLIFVRPPDLETLEQRIRDRGQDSEAAIAARLSAASEEIRISELFDESVVNDDVDRCVGAITDILGHYSNGLDSRLPDSPADNV